MNYYSFSGISEKSRLFNFIITPRSAGKTIAMKRRVVDDYLKDGSRFVYVRRNGVEIENKKLATFFEKMQSLGYHSGHDLTLERGIFYCDGNPFGYAVALSTSINERSVDFVNVKHIYFEEFCMKPDSNHRYLDDEVERFLDLYSTVAREDEVQVWFLGNKMQEFNPYFLYFDIRPPTEGIKVWKDFAVEIWNNLEFTTEKKNTRFGRLISGTAYSDYAIDNIGLTNNQNFSRKLPRRSVPFCGIVYNKQYYTIYQCMDSSIQISCDTPPPHLPVVCLSIGENSPDFYPVKAFRKTLRGQVIKKSIESNNFYHSDGKSEEVGNIFKKGIYFI